jgi:NitT/TauT family transport system ATP-binding protein
VEEGLAEIVALGARIWQRGVEKVLAMRAAWLEENGESVDRLLVSLAQAAAWCDEPDNRAELAALLALPEYVGQPASLIARSLSGELVPRRNVPPVQIDDFLIFNREAAAFPWRSQAMWIYSQLVRWGHVEPSAEAQAAAGGVFRSDVYRRALAGAGIAMPGASLKLEGAVSAPTGVGAHRGALTLGPDRFFDGRIFDPHAIDEYLASFAR